MKFDAKVSALIDKLTGTQVDLTLPKFRFETKTRLNAQLIALGMTDAISGKADFSTISGKPVLFIRLVQHNAFIDADEADTEAAAAPAVVMSPTGIPHHETLTVDRPFIFLILDHNATDTILFVGRVLNPT